MKARNVRPGDFFDGVPSYTVTDVTTLDKWTTNITGDDGNVRTWDPDEETGYKRAD